VSTLEAGLLPAGGRLRIVASKRPPPQENVPGRKTDVKDAEWICQLV
jgi:hypothetical protein